MILRRDTATVVSVFILKTIGLSIENWSHFPAAKIMKLILWLHLRPKSLPRGFSSLIVAVIYHPHWTTGENDYMREHLFQSLVRAESTYPNCAIIIAGDFNRLNISTIKKHFRLKQIVKKPTRKLKCNS